MNPAIPEFVPERKAINQNDLAAKTPNADILIVDDMPDNLHILSQTLKRFGYKVRAVTDGELAITAAEAAPPDLIMLDVDMPGLDGYETCRRLKADPLVADIPIIFISALGDVSDKIKAFQVGGVDYVTKPFHIEEVQARIETHLTLRRLRTQLEDANEELQTRLVELSAAREAEREQRHLAETLRDTIAALNSTLEYDAVLDLILDNLGKVVPHVTANIALLDQNGVARVERARGYSRDELDMLHKTTNVPAWSLGPWRKVMESHRMLFIADTLQHPNWQVMPGFESIRSFICAPIIVKSRVIGFINLESPEPNFFAQGHGWRLQTFADQAAVAIEKARLFDETQRLATTDGLTGVYNRRHLLHLAEHEFERARRFRHHLAVIMSDIDHFKLVNDTYGHPIGDLVLQNLARLFKENLRAVDLLGRYGGEEFLLLLPESGIEQAAAAAERLRQQVEQAYSADLFPVPVTISLGVASGIAGADLTLAGLIKLADDALYDAKAGGRNRASIANLETQIPG